MLMMPTIRPPSTTGVPEMRLARRTSRNSAIVVCGVTVMTGVVIASRTRSS
jgi:hypothetical protein